MSVYPESDRDGDLPGSCSRCAEVRRIETFNVNWCPVARSHPQDAALPARVCGVHAADLLAKNRIG